MAAHTDNAVVIDAPREFVWSRMMDIESWPTLFSEYAKAEVIEQDGNYVKFRLTTHPDPDYDGQVWSWVSERTADPENFQSKSKRIETGPFEYMNIEWYFEEEGDGTKMRWVQDFSMKPEAPADDAGAQEYMNKNTKVQMDVIKERLEQDATGGSA
jgi:aromatase